MRIAAILFTLLAAPASANSVQTPLAPLPEPEAIVPQVSEQAVKTSLRPVARRMVIPAARWDKTSGRKSWTLATLSALKTHATVLPDIVPRDIAEYCPAYPHAPREVREAFWVGLTSALAWHESTHRPGAVGGGGKWYGLTQILPATARGYGCKARSGEALKDPEDNLSCALRIMAKTVKRDRVISAGMRGVAADWGPFHSAKKRADMKAWTRKQPYCSGLFSSLKPVARPDHIGPEPQSPATRPEMIAKKPGLNAAEIISTQSHARF